MARVSVPRSVSGLDDELVEVGRAVISLKATRLADMIHHVASYRRPGGMLAVYQVDQATTRGTAADEQFSWRYLTGANSRKAWARALLLGSVGSGGASDHGQLNLVTTSPAATVDFGGEIANGPAAGATIADAIPVEAMVTVTAEGQTNTFEVDQQNTSNPLRILAIALDELPCSSIVIGTDAVSVDTRQFAPSRDIIVTEYEDLALALHKMRRLCKKIVHATCKIVTTTAVQPAGVGEDIYTGSSMNYMLWDLSLSPVRPENTTTPVTCYVRAAHSASDGRVRFAFGTGTPGDITINSSTPAWYSTTANIAKGTDTLSIQCWGNAAGTFTLYGAVVCETHETA